MATGWSGSMLKYGQEEYYEWRCRVCEEDGLMKEAAAYCTTCDDCFCDPCLQIHIKFNKNKHNVLGVKEKVQWGKPSLKGDPGIECPDHQGQTVTMYCGHHDDLCCSVCVSIKHSDKCKSKLSYIPHLAKDIQNGDEFIKANIDNNRLISTFTKLVHDRKGLQVEMNASRNDCKRRIEEIHCELATQLNKLKDDSITEMNKKHDEIDERIKDDIDNCQRAKRELEIMKQQMNPTSISSDSLIFVGMKSVQKGIAKYKNVSEYIAAPGRHKLTFIPNDSIRKSVLSARMLGECVDVSQNPPKPRIIPGSVKPAKEQCTICMGTTKKLGALACGHTFCTDCIAKTLRKKEKCPTCGVLTGDQPIGTMTSFIKFEDIEIAYSFPQGVQESHHPNPGRPYGGKMFEGALPDNSKGKVVLQMLRIAFDRKLMFTIGSGRNITWNGVELSNRYTLRSDNYLYSPEYLERLKKQLAAKGITEKDIPQNTLKKQ